MNIRFKAFLCVTYARTTSPAHARTLASSVVTEKFVIQFRKLTSPSLVRSSIHSHGSQRSCGLELGGRGAHAPRPGAVDATENPYSCQSCSIRLDGPPSEACTGSSKGRCCGAVHAARTRLSGAFPGPESGHRLLGLPIPCSWVAAHPTCGSHLSHNSRHPVQCAAGASHTLPTARLGRRLFELRGHHAWLCHCRWCICRLAPLLRL